jgi:hypothetical protein
MSTRPDTKGTDRPRKDGTPEVQAEVGSDAAAEAPEPFDASYGGAPTGRVPREAPRTLIQGTGSFATLGLTEEDHKCVRTALQVYGGEMGLSPQGVRARNILRAMMEGL